MEIMTGDFNYTPRYFFLAKYVFNVFFNRSECTHTAESTNDEWFSLELQEEEPVTKVQIARRMDCCWEQGQKIRITIGPSQSYDPNEPLCLPEITELQRVAGLQDYACTMSTTLSRNIVHEDA